MNNNSPLSHRKEEPENGILYIVGTPIGNLNDISQRALNILRNVSLVACEDTRQTKKIMNKFNISNKLISFNKHNSLIKIPIIVRDLKEGKSIAIVSDAGMPGICDPGEDIAKSVKSEGIDIICVPGACAAITALVSSGLPSSSFIFEGFLPKKKIDREKILLEISKNEKTTIIYESPKRLRKLLNELLELCGGEREIIVARELTKKFEEHVGNNINKAIEFFRDKDIIGEITIVIRGIRKSDFIPNKSIIKKDLTDLIDAGLSLSAASKYLAKKNGLKKSEVYNLI
ncbi:16S rRNA (cytidine(1402)-2'-O)-methyltransferase [Prochlorococcus marinus XMU1414]|uniref:Ribosomal RNA small subunit methyltransferase I n=1 Tax=Prochlorococcus marinus XMU1424 TaxID=2774497 RepID=A0A9D9BTK7_PROMR|nr:16S rRNA (cytidine(1402)-2'-O)-methyltransferase [Prochlorococcus marinus]MBO8228650.1 16S rRNA (cytidine(1402)-2'-O)-methyltransferase [Prochlorococcus marinus XMU1414]MBW3046128.1 16S rRNA (cytidine(1402)-2'-O)-methyltransferase [Prochlorococcus marinus str. MU1414]MCR8531580.1 16S rRNA (cytidine(1402)-2'-O)-methyltransferase [Prochlorococcus marinus XMU1420]MCR8535309.1 16S rRNA (cytidine(1402)-2'-O)-methyltransferase [Prochlorococcus marinus XMU1424]